MFMYILENWLLGNDKNDLCITEKLDVKISNIWVDFYQYNDGKMRKPNIKKSFLSGSHSGEKEDLIKLNVTLDNPK